MTTAERATETPPAPNLLDDPEIAAKVAEYAKLPYTVCLYYDDSESDPVWMAYVDELDGCMSHGDTPEEATAMIREAMEGWLAVAVKYGDPIPPPKEHFPEYDGSFRMRVPAGLHERLAREAKAQRVSLNQLVTAILAEGVGWSPARDRD